MKKETDGLEDNIIKMIDNLLDEKDTKPKDEIQVCINGEHVQNTFKVPRKSASNKTNNIDPNVQYSNFLPNNQPFNSTGNLIDINKFYKREELDMERSSTNYSNTFKNFTIRSRVSSEW